VSALADRQTDMLQMNQGRMKENKKKWKACVEKNGAWLQLDKTTNTPQGDLINP